MADDPGEYAVITRGLRKAYGRRVAVAGVDLAVRRRQIFGFLGPNGAGKTTTIKLLLGLVFPTSGLATVLGRPAGDPAAKRRIGFLPEQFRFHDWLRAEEFLDFHGQLYGLEPENRRERIPIVLQQVGLVDRAGDRLSTFSKGMLQRVGLAQALLPKPELVILDEPTSALDPLGRRDVRDLLRRLRDDGVTVFLSSHLLSDVEQICDDVAIMAAGEIVRSGPLLEQLARQLELEIRVERVNAALLRALEPFGQPVVDQDETVRVLLDRESVVPDVAAAILSVGGRLRHLALRRLTLEDLFVEAVQTPVDVAAR